MLLQIKVEYRYSEPALPHKKNIATKLTFKKEVDKAFNTIAIVPLD